MIHYADTSFLCSICRTQEHSPGRHRHPSRRKKFLAFDARQKALADFAGLEVVG